MRFNNIKNTYVLFARPRHVPRSVLKMLWSVPTNAQRVSKVPQGPPNLLPKYDILSRNAQITSNMHSKCPQESKSSQRVAEKPQHVPNRSCSQEQSKCPQSPSVPQKLSPVSLNAPNTTFRTSNAPPTNIHLEKSWKKLCRGIVPETIKRHTTTSKTQILFILIFKTTMQSISAIFTIP